jgi:hypothetical protein
MKVSLVFLLCRGQMGVVGKRAKKEKKEEKFQLLRFNILF